MRVTHGRTRVYTYEYLHVSTERIQLTDERTPEGDEWISESDFEIAIVFLLVGMYVFIVFFWYAKLSGIEYACIILITQAMKRFFDSRFRSALIRENLSENTDEQGSYEKNKTMTGW